jgi:hypothetical protein
VFFLPEAFATLRNKLVSYGGEFLAFCNRLSHEEKETAAVAKMKAFTFFHFFRGINLIQKESFILSPPQTVS